jgi:hypothetical protein
VPMDRCSLLLTRPSGTRPGRHISYSCARVLQHHLEAISTRMLRLLQPHSSRPRAPQAVWAPPLLGAHVALERRYVPVSRHVPYSAHMPPPQIFFVLCLDAARLECTRLHPRGPWLDYELLRQPRSVANAVWMECHLAVLEGSRPVYIFNICS